MNQWSLFEKYLNPAFAFFGETGKTCPNSLAFSETASQRIR